MGPEGLRLVVTRRLYEIDRVYRETDAKTEVDTSDIIDVGKSGTTLGVV